MHAIKPRTLQMMLVTLVIAAMLAACGAPAADTTTAPAADATAAEGTSAEAPAAEIESPELPEVPRNRTLIIMNGGPNQYALFNNQNPFSASQGEGFHMGTLPAVKEPLIMFNVLTGEYENWLAENWEYNEDNTEITLFLRDGVKWSDGEAFNRR